MPQKRNAARLLKALGVGLTDLFDDTFAYSNLAEPEPSTRSAKDVGEVVSAFPALAPTDAPEVNPSSAEELALIQGSDVAEEYQVFKG